MRTTRLRRFNFFTNRLQKRKKKKHNSITDIGLKTFLVTTFDRPGTKNPRLRVPVLNE